MFRLRPLQVLLVCAVGLLIPRLMYAAEATNPCTIAKADSIDGHRYALCQVMRVEGTLHGDLIVGAADSVIINGTVDGDVLSVTNQLIINGTVGGSVRAIAADIHIDKGAKLGGKLSDIAGLGLTLESAIPLPGEVWYAGRKVTLPEGVAGPKHIFLLPSTPRDTPNLIAGYLSNTLRDWFALLTVGLLAQLIRPAGLNRMSQALTAALGRCALWGGVGLLGLFLAASTLPLAWALTVGALTLFTLGQLTLLVALTMTGLAAGLLGAGVLLVGFGARAVVAHALGRWFAVRVHSRTDRASRMFLSMVAGALGCAMVCNVPFVGLPISLLVAILGLGAILRGLDIVRLWTRDRVQEKF